MDSVLPRADLTKKRLAEEVGIPEYQLYRWMRAEGRGPPATMRRKINLLIRSLIPDAPTAEIPEFTDEAVQTTLRQVEREGTELSTRYPSHPGVVQALGLVGSMGTAVRRLRERLHEHRLITTNMRDVIWVAGLDQRFTYHSPNVVDLTGFTEHELLGRHFTFTLTADSARHAAKVARQAWDRGIRDRKWTHSFRLIVEAHRRNPPGLLWLDVEAAFWLDNSGRPTSIVGASRDVTEWISAHVDLWAGVADEKRSAALVDRAGVFVMVDDEFARALGYASGRALRGKAFREITHPGDVRESVRRFSDFLVAPEVDGYAFTKRYLSADGESVPVTLRVRSIAPALPPSGPVAVVTAEWH